MKQWNKHIVIAIWMMKTNVKVCNNMLHKNWCLETQTLTIPHKTCAWNKQYNKIGKNSTNDLLNKVKMTKGA